MTRMMTAKTINDKTLIVLTGPTAVGKTALSIEIAQELGTGIISADARQFYKELKIGSAAPSKEEMKKVKHHFVGHLTIKDYYNAWIFENEALKVINDLFISKNHVILTGGSGLYIDAVCQGIEILPDIDPVTRNNVKKIYRKEKLTGLRKILKKVDPEYYKNADLLNPNRIMRAIEIYMATGKKLSQYHAESKPKKRPFRIVRIVFNRPRHELFDRIGKRTDEMIHRGLVEEAWSLFPYRHYNALNTLGYKEIFAFFSNEYPLAAAVDKIKTNTRRYAKRQLTWFKKYDDAIWLQPGDKKKIMQLISLSDQ